MEKSEMLLMVECLGLTTEDLQDLVLDVASQNATHINNGGIDEQMEFMLGEKCGVKANPVAVAEAAEIVKVLGTEAHDLDEEVHDRWHNIASAFNNEGIDGQLDFLMSECTEDELRVQLRELAKGPVTQYHCTYQPFEITTTVEAVEGVDPEKVKAKAKAQLLRKDIDVAFK